MHWHGGTVMKQKGMKGNGHNLLTIYSLENIKLFSLLMAADHLF